MKHIQIVEYLCLLLHCDSQLHSMHSAEEFHIDHKFHIYQEVHICRVWYEAITSGLSRLLGPKPSGQQGHMRLTLE